MKATVLNIPRMFTAGYRPREHYQLIEDDDEVETGTSCTVKRISVFFVCVAIIISGLLAIYWGYDIAGSIVVLTIPIGWCLYLPLKSLDWRKCFQYLRAISCFRAADLSTPELPTLKQIFPDPSTIHQPFSDPPVIRQPIPGPSSAEVSLPLPSSSEAPLQEPSSSEAPLQEPSSSEAPLQGPSSAEVPLQGPSSGAETSLLEPSSAEAPIPGPSSAEAPIPGPSSAEAPIPGPSSAEALIPGPPSEETSPSELSSAKAPLPRAAE